MKTPMGKVDSKFALIMLDELLKAGFTMKDLSNMTGIKYVTMTSIIRNRGKLITEDFNDAIRSLYNTYQIDRIKEEMDNPVIDPEDEKEGAREVAIWTGIAVLMFVLMLVGLVVSIRFVIGLF